MSKEAEEFFRQKTIENTKRPRMKKFLELVNREQEGKIMQEYTDQQLLLYSVSQQRELLSQYNDYLNMQYQSSGYDDSDISDFFEWLNCG